ncbi:hypothetical protein AAIR98_001141 [Elusimicrobium simillimum]|uniref:hypothetical protein n=1 Tax=Elusimicrobium simillimum TaxID=3143438 RepID=UPI003C6EA964
MKRFFVIAVLITPFLAQAQLPQVPALKAKYAQMAATEEQLNQKLQQAVINKDAEEAERLISLFPGLDVNAKLDTFGELKFMGKQTAMHAVPLMHVAIYNNDPLTLKALTKSRHFNARQSATIPFIKFNPISPLYLAGERCYKCLDIILDRQDLPPSSFLTPNNTPVTLSFIHNPDGVLERMLKHRSFSGKLLNRSGAMGNTLLIQVIRYRLFDTLEILLKDKRLDFAQANTLTDAEPILYVLNYTLAGDTYKALEIILNSKVKLDLNKKYGGKTIKEILQQKDYQARYDLAATTQGPAAEEFLAGQADTYFKCVQLLEKHLISSK